MDTLLEQYKRSYKRGNYLCRQDDEATHFFILISGAVGVYNANQMIATLDQPGEYFGEMGALLKQNRTATLKAETAVTCYALPVNMLDKLLKDNPHISAKLVLDLANRLKHANEEIINLRPRKRSA